MVIHKLKVQKKYSTYHKKLPFLAGSELDVDHPGLDQTAAGRRRGGCPQGQAGQEKEDPPGREPVISLSQSTWQKKRYFFVLKVPHRIFGFDYKANKSNLITCSRVKATWRIIVDPRPSSLQTLY